MVLKYFAGADLGIPVNSMHALCQCPEVLPGRAILMHDQYTAPEELACSVMTHLPNDVLVWQQLISQIQVGNVPNAFKCMCHLLDTLRYHTLQQHINWLS